MGKEMRSSIALDIVALEAELDALRLKRLQELAAMRRERITAVRRVIAKNRVVPRGVESVLQKMEAEITGPNRSHYLDEMLDLVEVMLGIE